MTLNNYLRDSLSRPYEVGEWDCALFVAEWVDILTGSDRADYFRGLYQEKEEGLAQFGPLRRRVAMELDSLGFFKAEKVGTLPTQFEVAAAVAGSGWGLGYCSASTATICSAAIGRLRRGVGTSSSTSSGSTAANATATLAPTARASVAVSA